MDDHPPRRLLRLLLTGALLVFAWGIASSVAEEARSDVPSAQTLARSPGLRLASGRFGADLTELPALPAPPVEAEEPGAGDPAAPTLAPRTPVRGRPASSARLPRAPPAAPLHRID